MSVPRPAAYLMVALVVPCVTGCPWGGAEEDPRQQLADDFGRLPGLSETPDPKLRDELDRIVDEGATPELLGRNPVPDEENVAAVLAGLFKPKRLPSLVSESTGVFSSGDFRFNPTRLEKAIRFRWRYDVQRQQAREALDRPRCNFGIQYQAGFAADLSCVDVVRVCTRLEAFHAAELLSGDDVAGAIESLQYMFRLVACLAAEKHTTARLEAAFLRDEAWSVLQALVEHPDVNKPKITRPQLEELAATVQGQLKSWPSDADAWIGDRALGMHAYELVRAGRLTDMLTEEEIQRFQQEDILDELAAAALRVVNQDELYYLDAMRRIIDGCRQPYYKRRDLFERIRKDLHEKRESPEFPVVAGRLLLPEIEKGHAIQARDRAKCEAWAVALALAAGREPPPYEISPLTGQKYTVIREKGLVEVWDRGAGEDGLDRPVVVPDLAGSASKGSEKGA